MIWVIGSCDNKLLGTSPINGMNGRMFSPAALTVTTELIGGSFLLSLGRVPCVADRCVECRLEKTAGMLH